MSVRAKHTKANGRMNRHDVGESFHSKRSLQQIDVSIFYGAIIKLFTFYKQAHQLGMFCSFHFDANFFHSMTLKVTREERREKRKNFYFFHFNLFQVALEIHKIKREKK